MRIVTLVWCGLATGLALLAADSRADAQLSMPSVYAGYTYEPHSTLYGPVGPVPIWIDLPGALRGWDASVEEPFTEWFRLRLNVGRRRGSVWTTTGCELAPPGCTPSPTNDVSTQRTALIGPAFSANTGPFRFFGHLLVGAAWLDSQASVAGSPGGSQRLKAFALQPGAGIDIALARPIALRVEGDRFEPYYDYSWAVHMPSKNTAVLSTGLVVRFGAR
jgi:hypothetical protein